MSRKLAHSSRRVASVFVLFMLAACFAAQKRPPINPIDLNTATAAELRQLPGIGPSMAQAIVKFREKSGPLQRVEDLLAIRGISKTKLEKLRPYVTLKPSANKTP